MTRNNHPEDIQLISEDNGNDVSEDMPATSELTMCNPSRDKQKFADT